jgi:hypothetical protein
MINHIYRDVRSVFAKMLQPSTINFDGVVCSCFVKRMTDEPSAYTDLNVGMGYQVTLLDDVTISIPQVIRQQSKGIYPVLKSADNPSARLFCINEYLTLADGAIALNGYICYTKE